MRKFEPKKNWRISIGVVLWLIALALPLKSCKAAIIILFILSISLLLTEIFIQWRKPKKPQL